MQPGYLAAPPAVLINIGACNRIGRLLPDTVGIRRPPCVDHGNVYVSELVSGSVKKIAPDGAVATLASVTDAGGIAVRSDGGHLCGLANPRNHLFIDPEPVERQNRIDQLGGADASHGRVVGLESLSFVSVI